MSVELSKNFIANLTHYSFRGFGAKLALNTKKEVVRRVTVPADEETSVTQNPQTLSQTAGRANA